MRFFFTVLFLGVVSAYGQVDVETLHLQSPAWAIRHGVDMEDEYDYPMRVAFRDSMMNLLSEPGSMSHTYDSLGQFVTIRSSEDGRVRLFSWDDLFITCNHTMHTLIQYSWNDSVRVVDISEREDDDYLSTLFHEIHTIREEDGTYYLLIGWGAHCGGGQHQQARLFTIKQGNLVSVPFEVGGEFDKRLHNVVSRHLKMRMVYEREARELWYWEYEGCDQGPLECTDQRYLRTLKWSGSKFVAND